MELSEGRAVVASELLPLNKRVAIRQDRAVETITQIRRFRPLRSVRRIVRKRECPLESAVPPRYGNDFICVVGRRSIDPNRVVDAPFALPPNEGPFTFGAEAHFPIELRPQQPS